MNELEREYWKLADLSYTRKGKEKYKLKKKKFMLHLFADNISLKTEGVESVGIGWAGGEVLKG